MNENLNQTNKKLIRLRIGIAIEVLIVIMELTIFGLLFYNHKCPSGPLKRLDEAQIAQFNGPFIRYSGVQYGNWVKKLIMEVNSHNLEFNFDPDLQIKINSTFIEKGQDTILNFDGSIKEDNEPNFECLGQYLTDNIVNKNRYSVTLDYVDGDETSYICNIRIQEYNN